MNGKTRLALVVLRELGDEPDGEYGHEKVIRYRVLRPGSWELYREKTENGKKEIVLEGSGTTKLREIPLAIVYSRKCGWLESQPPLIDIAEANISHYQKYNDLSIYLHLCRPILCRKNADKKPVQNISAYAVMDVSTDGDVWYAEPTGAGLEPSATDIDKIEQRISVLGLSLLVKQTRTGQVTATEERNDQIEESSDLSSWVENLRDAVELALRFHAQYLNSNAQTGGSIEIGSSLNVLELTSEEMAMWSNAVAAGQFSVETMWSVFARGGKLPKDFDEKVERRRIDEEAQRKADLADQALTAFERGGAAD